VTLTVQDLPPARLVPQVFVCLNTDAPVPVIDTVSVAAVLPEFVTVTLFAALVVPTV
jgi:hypothetical protein